MLFTWSSSRDNPRSRRNRSASITTSTSASALGTPRTSAPKMRNSRSRPAWGRPYRHVAFT